MESRTVIAVTLYPGLDNDLVMRTTAHLLWVCCLEVGAGYGLPASGIVWDNPYPRDELTDQHSRAAIAIVAASHWCYIVPVLDDDEYTRTGLSGALEVRKRKNIGNILILIDGDISDIVNSVLTEEDVKGERKKKGEKDVKGSRIEDMHAFIGKHFLFN